jgi:hypothetical protein
MHDNALTNNKHIKHWLSLDRKRVCRMHFVAIYGSVGQKSSQLTFIGLCGSMNQSMFS